VKKNNVRPIGVFDSGLGGLTVAKAIMRQLPDEEIVYFGDTARVPYGTKSKESIVRFSVENAGILLRHDVKMLVVACNSSSSYAIPTLRRHFKVPVIGVIEPGARKAVAITRNRRVGVIATSATINSGKYVEAIRRFNPRVKAIGMACPLFVPLVEEGWFDSSITMAVAEYYLSALKKANVDTLILGCTHYPLLKGVLKLVMGPHVQLIDSAGEVALEARKTLEMVGRRPESRKRPRHHFLVSDRPQFFERLARRFLDDDINGFFHHRTMKVNA
jgi:glutamate racemase